MFEVMEMSRSTKHERKCPLCGSNLRKTQKNRYVCTNPKCIVYMVKFNPSGKINRIIYATVL